MSFGMKRLERLRTVQHDMAMRDLSDVDRKIEDSRAQLSSVSADVLQKAQAATIDVNALMDADLSRKAIENRIVQLGSLRATRADAANAAAMAKKQAEMLVQRTRERTLAEREGAEARAMDEMAAQIWRRT